jgi:hypothetical protein
MTKFKVTLKKRTLLIIPRTHTIQGKGYAVSTHAEGIKRLVIYDDNNRHVFTTDWDNVECINLSETK